MLQIHHTTCTTVRDYLHTTIGQDKKSSEDLVRLVIHLALV